MLPDMTNITPTPTEFVVEAQKQALKAIEASFELAERVLDAQKQFALRLVSKS
jgi:hypothetical protein